MEKLFVSYQFEMNNGATGLGNTTFESDKRLKTHEHVREVEKALVQKLKEQSFDIKNVVVINFIYLV